MVALCAVTASVIGRAAFGSATFLTAPAFHVVHPAEFALFALLGPKPSPPQRPSPGLRPRDSRPPG
jgi:hypothetical protein